MKNKYNYVYRLTINIPDDSRKYYVGKHSGLLDDFQTGKYKTSSKIVSRLIVGGVDFKCKIVRVFETAKEAISFESKYHKKLNVKKHPLFFNLANQTSDKFDRSGMVTVVNKITNERETINCENYDKSLYVSIYNGEVAAIDLETNKIVKITQEEFYNNKDCYVGIRKGMINVVNKETGETQYITKEEFHKNSSKYDYTLNIKGYTTVLDLETNKIVKISLEEFYNNKHKYKGVQAIKGHQHKDCEICGQSIQIANYNNHLKTHENNYIYITDPENFQTYKVLNKDYFLKYKSLGFTLTGRKNGVFGYYKGEKIHLRKLGKMIKRENISLELSDN